MSRQAFHERLDLNGVILTKLDGDARGGAALSVRASPAGRSSSPRRGEKLDDLDGFHPDRMASRILGMGDVLDARSSAPRRRSTTTRRTTSSAA